MCDAERERCIHIFSLCLFLFFSSVVVAVVVVVAAAAVVVVLFSALSMDLNINESMKKERDVSIYFLSAFFIPLPAFLLLLFSLLLLLLLCAACVCVYACV